MSKIEVIREVFSDGFKKGKRLGLTLGITFLIASVLAGPQSFGEGDIPTTKDFFGHRVFTVAREVMKIKFVGFVVIRAKIPPCQEISVKPTDYLESHDGDGIH